MALPLPQSWTQQGHISGLESLCEGTLWALAAWLPHLVEGAVPGDSTRCSHTVGSGHTSYCDRRDWTPSCSLVLHISVQSTICSHHHDHPCHCLASAGSWGTACQSKERGPRYLPANKKPAPLCAAAASEQELPWSPWWDRSALFSWDVQALKAPLAGTEKEKTQNQPQGHLPCACPCSAKAAAS